MARSTSGDPFGPRCVQVVGSVAAAVVVCMALSAGSAVHHVIQQSVYVDSILPDTSMDVASAAKKLNGLLYAGLAVLICNLCMSILSFTHNALWLVTTIAGQFGLKLSAHWSFWVEQYPWDCFLGPLWFIISVISWLFRRIAAEWINGNPTMQFVLTDGVRCTRCPTMLSSTDGSQWIVVNNVMTVMSDACEGGCHNAEARASLDSMFTLLRAGYWIAVILAVICASTVKMLYGNSAGANSEPQQQQQQRQHAGARYSALPLTQQQAEGAARMQQQTSSASHVLVPSMQQQAAGPHHTQQLTATSGHLQQQPSAEMCLLTVESG